jgi:hypothetical protein
MWAALLALALAQPTTPPEAAGPEPTAQAPARGTGLLIAAAGVGTGALAGRVLFGVAVGDQINSLTRDQALRIYRVGALISLPAGAAFALLAAARAQRARFDLHDDVRIAGSVADRRARIAAGWTLFGAGVAAWGATRLAAPAVAHALPRGEMFVLYMESTWYASALLTGSGLWFGVHGSAYSRVARRWALGLDDLALAPTWSGGRVGLSLAGRF